MPSCRKAQSQNRFLLRRKKKEKRDKSAVLLEKTIQIYSRAFVTVLFHACIRWLNRRVQKDKSPSEIDDNNS